MAHDTQYMFESHDQILVVFTFLGCFRELLPQFWVFGVIFKAHDTWYLFDRHDQKLVVFCIYGHFCELFPTVLGFSVSWG
jgi:hypothetical protein